jgi:hypothetical protein
MKSTIRLMAATAFVAVFSPGLALACACGCGVFDVGTGTMMPTDEGGTVWFEYDFMNQQTNWHDASEGPRANNPDKVLRSNFFQFGGQYMFNRSWGIMGTVPFTDRYFKTTDDDSGDLLHHQHTAFGDLHLQGVYSGFSGDMSTGVTFGLKLPSGDFTYTGFDRDTAIGTGSTDLLLGVYHMGALIKQFDWFVNGQLDHAFLTQGGYRPGDEVDAALGSYYNGFEISKTSKIAPLLQLIGSYRVHDTGSQANPGNSGYERLMISPGIEYDIDAVKLYGDVEVPIYQHVNGNQIVAPIYAKFIVGYSF